VDKDFDRGQESVYSNKVRAGRRRTYFFDVRQTKGDDYYITLTESTRRFNGDGYSRHKIFLYKEDFNRFVEGLQDAVGHVKNELMPDYDYEQFDRKQEEWDKAREEEAAANAALAQESPAEPVEETAATDEVTTTEESPAESTSEDIIESDEDMDW